MEICNSIVSDINVSSAFPLLFCTLANSPITVIHQVRAGIMNASTLHAIHTTSFNSILWQFVVSSLTLTKPGAEIPRDQRTSKER